MLTEQQRQAASDLLWDLWRTGRRVAALPEELRPATRADGYAVQALLERRSAHPVFGWKIAATSQAGQRHIGVDGPLAGRLLRERVAGSGAELKLGANHMRVAEPEFAFRMLRDLPARAAAYSLNEVMAATDTLHPAIELPDSRYEDFCNVGAAQLIADNACAHYFVLGPAAPNRWRSQDLVQQVVTGTVTDKLRCEGKGANVLGDPRAALTWLVNELSRLGVQLTAGQVVTTGTCVTPLPVVPGDHVTADFGELGRVELSFARQEPTA
ncbi:MAG TPA: fumarylacetoacetate hydrolase family protein [Burkholderiales bacterium]|nr:fumarylacetoacetate hydrolase family protein [Burkholderiales bacterium]